TACQAGASNADRLPIRNRKSSSVAGLANPAETSAANKAEMTAIEISRTRIKRRLSKMSASAPAGRANRNMGRVFATWTRETMNGLGSRLVMSQPAAALYIHSPMFETRLASQIILKRGCRNALDSEAAGPRVRPGSPGFAGCGGARAAIVTLLPADGSLACPQPTGLAQFNCRSRGWVPSGTLARARTFTGGCGGDGRGTWGEAPN